MSNIFVKARELFKRDAVKREKPNASNRFKKTKKK